MGEKNTNSIKTHKIIGGYKREGWALRILDKISNDSVTKEENDQYFAKAIILSKSQTFYPAFLMIDMKQKGKVTQIYFISESTDQFDLIPHDMAEKHTNEDLFPIQYKTVVQIKGDQYQKNWPNYS